MEAVAEDEAAEEAAAAEVVAGIVEQVAADEVALEAAAEEVIRRDRRRDMEANTQGLTRRGCPGSHPERPRRDPASKARRNSGGPSTRIRGALGNEPCIRRAAALRPPEPPSGVPGGAC